MEERELFEEEELPVVVGDYELVKVQGGVQIRHVGSGHAIETVYDMETAMDRVSMVKTGSGDELPKLECEYCEIYDEYYPTDDVTWIDGCGYVPDDDAVEDYRGEWQLESDCERVELSGYGTAYILSTELEEDWQYCDRCGRYVLNDDYDGDTELCEDCAREERENSVIGDYHSHRKDTWFGKPDKNGVYKGLGFELEIDRNPNSSNRQCDFNTEFASHLMERSGLADDECVFEEDGSLWSGFEIISMPHTVDDFWSKKDKWVKMLELCSKAGFKSHDARNCGLHIHVSREMFGKYKKEQDKAIAKVLRFYEKKWDDLARASRRRDFGYCQRVGNTDSNGNHVLEDSPVEKWVEVSKRTYHSAAVNNTGTRTVEFRLGRGTLNPRSFLSWIDLTLAIVKNSKKSYVDLKDPKEWLEGISPYTAEYLASRNSFMDELKVLMPEAIWATSSRDSQED